MLIKKRANKKLGSLAISEIIILIFGTIAFAYIIGSEIEVVSGAELSFTFTHPKKGITSVQYSETFEPEIKIGLPGGGEDFSFFKNSNYLGETPGAGFVATDGQSVYYLQNKIWNQYKTADIIGDINFVPPETAGGVPQTIGGWPSNLPLQTSSEITSQTTPKSILEAGGEAGTLGGPGEAATAAGTAGRKGIFKKIFEFATKKFWQPASIGQALAYAGIAVGAAGAVQFFITLVKTGDAGRAFDSALRIGGAAGIGYLAGTGVTQGLIAAGIISGPAGWITALVMGVAIWASRFLKRHQDRTITFICKPWQAQSGGDNCKLCNDRDFPCTEYQCKSLGTACELINKESDEPRCVYKDPGVNPPYIFPLEEALAEGYRYEPLPRGQYGVEIKYGDRECLPPFQPFSFGIELFYDENKEEPKEGYCRYDFIRTENFSAMEFDFGGRNLYLTKHIQQMSFPGNSSELGEEMSGVYVRCESVSGKANREEFFFKFCIDEGPDTTSPEIRGFNWRDNSPIAYFAENEPREVNVQVYVNEPASCKWDHEDKSYENMENNLTCPNSLIDFNAQLSYTCSGKLTGLENGKENKFYFRCKDLFENVNIQSKTLTLIGTRPLYISDAKPNATTIKGSSDSIKVTIDVQTSAGYRQGEATCYYSNTGESGDYIIFSNTDSYKHSTNIWLEQGSYNYFIRCIDLAGNSETKEINFEVETDTAPPTIVRVYHEGNYLKIITNEKAECVYDVVNRKYNFEDGIKMGSTNEKIHYTDWQTDRNFYIKCKDIYNNKPFPDECSIIVRPQI